MLLARIFKALICFLLLVILSVKNIKAQIVINEFSSSGSDDWIELYNISSNQIDLNGWSIKDTASTSVKEFNEKLLVPESGYCIVEVGNRLNSSTSANKDRIELYQSGVLKDCVAYGDGDIFCSGKDKNDVDAPVEKQTASRSPNGTGEWRSSQATKKYSNDETLPPANLNICIEPTPTPSPTPTPTPSKSPTPSPTPTPSSTPAKSPTPTPEVKKTGTPKPSKSPTPSPQVLGETDTSPKPSVEEKENELPEKKVPVVAFVFIGLGVVFLGAGAAPFVWKEYTKRTRKNVFPQKNNTAS